MSSFLGFLWVKKNDDVHVNENYFCYLSFTGFNCTCIFFCKETTFNNALYTAFALLAWLWCNNAYHFILYTRLIHKTRKTLQYQCRISS